MIKNLSNVAEYRPICQKRGSMLFSNLKFELKILSALTRIEQPIVNMTTIRPYWFNSRRIFAVSSDIAFMVCVIVPEMTCTVSSRKSNLSQKARKVR